MFGSTKSDEVKGIILYEKRNQFEYKYLNDTVTACKKASII